MIAPYHITGVVPDFHFSSLLKINRNHSKQALSTFEEIYKSAMPGVVYYYDFLDDLTTKEYAKEERWKMIVSISATIALLISCLGLFGLAHLNTSQRIKEIGIRKILGASVNTILSLLATDFLKLVLLGIIIASSGSSYVLNKMADEFCLQRDFSWWILLIVGAGIVLISLLTVCIQFYDAATRTIVKSIKKEQGLHHNTYDYF